MDSGVADTTPLNYLILIDHIDLLPHADQLLVDETDARKEAERRKLHFIGALGILRRAAHLNLIDLTYSLRHLQQTTFYVSEEIIKSLLDEEKTRKERNRPK